MYAFLYVVNYTGQVDCKEWEDKNEEVDKNKAERISVLSYELFVLLCSAIVFRLLDTVMDMATEMGIRS